MKNFFVLLFFALQAMAAEPAPFSLFTIPKSGSHLLIKTLFFMTGYSPQWHTKPLQIETLYQQKQFPYTHFCLSTKLLDFYAYTPVKKIVAIRDLRDVCISIVYQIHKGEWPEFVHDEKKKHTFRKLSFDEQLMFVIQQEYELKKPRPILQLGIRKVAEQVASYVKDPSILICRYEDLVGAQGGGSDEAQRALLAKIASHLEISLLSQEVDALAASLYGNANNPFGQGNFGNYISTFRDGKIGSWKTVFKENHKKVFKERMGKALIALGYEKDDNW